MQKALPKQTHTLTPDAVRKHQKEATLPKIKSLYHKTRGPLGLYRSPEC